MASVTNRITSEKIYIEFLPLALAPATHIQHLYFDAAVDGGDFKLWVNGEKTAAIAYNAIIATFLTNINTALDALDNLSASDIVATGTVQTDITLTASGIGNQYLRIVLVDGYDTTLTQGTPNSNEKVTTEVTTQGSEWIRVSGDASALDWEQSVETVDVTAISEYDRVEIPVAAAVSGTLSLYKVQVDTSVVQVQLAMAAGNWGWLRIFPEGKIVGKEVISFRALLESFSEDYPDHEKIEQEVSFMRQQAWIDEPNSIWRG